MTTRRRYAFYAAATITAATLGGCALVAGLFEPRPLHCSNGVRDDKEEGVDCGGECPLCDGAKCASDDECTSQRCVSGKCSRPACLANSTNAADTCSACHRCPVEEPCASNLDCLSGFCATGVCAQCSKNTDCPTGNCVGTVCVAVTCNNGVKDNTEQGIDCGGDCATACPDGGAGGAGGTGGTGTGGTTTSSTGTGATGGMGTGAMGGMGTGAMGGMGTGAMGGMGTGGCSDGKKNGNETGVDCGGSCGKCADGQGCAMNADCQSGNCNGGATPTCMAAQGTCSDGVLNQMEMSVDCGGPCDACGKSCMMDTDCMSHNCVNQICRPTYCSKLMATTNCGFPVGASCSGNTDCWSGTCVGVTNVCM